MAHNHGVNQWYHWLHAINATGGWLHAISHLGAFLHSSTQLYGPKLHRFLAALACRGVTATRARLEYNNAVGDLGGEYLGCAAGNPAAGIPGWAKPPPFSPCRRFRHWIVDDAEYRSPELPIKAVQNTWAPNNLYYQDNTTEHTKLNHFRNSSGKLPLNRRSSKALTIWAGGANLYKVRVEGWVGTSRRAI